MAELINLPTDRDPTNKELGQAIVQTHGCVEELRKDIAPLQDIAKGVTLIRRIIVWAGPVIAASVIGGLFQNYTATQIAAANANAAAAASKTTASSQATVVKQLRSLGAAP